jgi:hypothetical protein
MTMDLSCPSCKSESTQKLALMYEQGLSDIDTSSKSVGIGIGGGGLGLGGAKSRTKGVSQTAASQRAAPPAKKRYVKPLLWIFGAFVVMQLFTRPGPVLGAVLSFLWIAASVAWIFIAYTFNAKTWPTIKAAWDNTFMCNRCSHTFQA